MLDVQTDFWNSVAEEKGTYAAACRLKAKASLTVKGIALVLKRS